jgi:HK97 gp10 family phage protein
MQFDGIGAKVTGIPDLRAALLSIPDKLRKRALRNALAAGARVVRDDAKRNAPVMAISMRTAVRKPGTLKNAIAVRTSKEAGRAGDVGVFVNVRPAKGGKRGAKSKDDPFYWRFVEFGHKIVGRYAGNYTDYKVRGRGRMTGLAARRRASTTSVPPYPFLVPASQRLGAALNVFLQKIGPQIQKLNGGKDVTL